MMTHILLYTAVDALVSVKVRSSEELGIALITIKPSYTNMDLLMRRHVASGPERSVAM